MKTYAPRPRDIERRWYVIDADGAVLGRLASEVAKILRGKHKPIFAPHADTGDHVVVVNARGVRLTGGKETKKVAHRHSGYPGGLRSMPYDRLLAERPATAVERAIRGMLPKNRLGRAMFRKLRVYEGAEHPHGPQNPMPLALGEVPRWEGLPAEPVVVPTKEKRPSARAEKVPTKSTPKAPTKGTAPEPEPERPAPKHSAPKRSKRSTAKAATPKRSTTKRSTAKRSTKAKAGEAKPKATRTRRKKKEE